MIATLRGEITVVSTDEVVVEAGGVGYRVRMSAAGISSLPASGEVFLHIFTNVREDALELFGFADIDEKRLFILLNSVSGVGPRLGLNILSGASCVELCRAIVSGDTAALIRLQGVGKKTAERLCLELKDKIDFVPVAESVPSVAAIPSDSVAADGVSALINLGYPAPAAKQVVNALRERLGEDAFAALSLEDLLRESLRSMA